jgi:hypothetical protein
MNSFQLATVFPEHNQTLEVMPTSIEQTYLSMKILNIGLSSDSTLPGEGGQGIENFLHMLRFH